MSKYAISGVSGYIGSHLADYLLEQGHEVVGLDNLSSGKRKNVPRKAKYYFADIREYDDIHNIIDMERPDVIFHLAAVSRTPWAVEQPLYTYQTNVVGSANVLEAAKVFGVKKVVLASSNIVYAGITPYRSSKLAMESIAQVYDELYELPTVCLRFSNVYGKVGDTPLRQHPDNVLMALSESKRKNGYITIFGDGDKITRNFTHVSDICKALLLAAESDVHNTNIDIMHPKAWALSEVAKMYDCEIKYTEERKGDIQALVMAGTAKASLLLGFDAEMNLEDYISPYINV